MSYGTFINPRGQGVREFEPKYEDPVSDFFIFQQLFYYTVNLLKMLPCNLLNDADVGNNNLV